MIVAGVMSGTSADGVDVAICRITPARITGDPPRVKLLGHAGFAYPKAVRLAVMKAMNAEAIPVADMSRLNWRLGEVYADAVQRAVATVQGKARPSRMSRPDDLSPVRGLAIRGQTDARNLADGRSERDRRASAGACGERLSPCRFRSGRTGRAARADARLCDVSRRKKEPTRC